MHFLLEKSDTCWRYSVEFDFIENQRLLRATSWYEFFAPLSNLRSGVFCKVYTFGRWQHVPAQLLQYVCKKGLISLKRELLLRKRLFRKGIDVFSKSGTFLINRK